MENKRLWKEGGNWHIFHGERNASLPLSIPPGWQPEINDNTPQVWSGTLSWNATSLRNHPTVNVLCVYHP